MDPEVRPPEREVPLPIEQRLRSLSLGITRWVADHLPRRWRENPLLIREAGLREGTPFHRSPFILAAALALAWVLSMWTLRVVGLFTDLLWTRESWSRWARSALYECAALLPVWFCARAWARERSESLRAQVALSRLTLSQLIDAKALVWLWILIAVAVLSTLFHFALMHSALLAPEGSGWHAYRIPYDLLSGWELAWWLFVIHILGPLGMLSHDVIRIGLATRLTLRWFNAPLGLIVAFAIDEGLQRGPSWLFGRLMQSGVTFQAWLSWTFGVLNLALPILLALAIWWHLPRRVARVYGMER